MHRLRTTTLAFVLFFLPAASVWASHNPCKETSLVNCGGQTCLWDHIPPDGCPPAPHDVAIPEAPHAPHDTQMVQIPAADYDRLLWQSGWLKQLYTILVTCAEPHPQPEHVSVPLSPNCPSKMQHTHCTLDGIACLTTCKEPTP